MDPLLFFSMPCTFEEEEKAAPSAVLVQKLLSTIWLNLPWEEGGRSGGAQKGEGDRSSGVPKEECGVAPLTCSLHVSSRQLGLQRLDLSFTDTQLALQSITLPLVAALLSMSMLQADAELSHLGIGFVQLV